MVTHETYRSPDGRWLAPDEVEVRDGGRIVEAATGAEAVRGRIEKMSKSKRNTIDPEPIVATYGADAVRWFMLSDSPPERDLEWSESGIEGAARFVQRVWRLVQGSGGGAGEDAQVDKKLHRTIAAVGEAIEGLQFNKAVAQLYELVGFLEKAAPSANRDAAIRTMVRLVAPMAPHLAEECWAALGERGLAATAEWPKHDPALLIDQDVTVAVQVNGKLRDTLSVPRGLARSDMEALALASDKIRRQLDGAAPRKVIVVPDRLVNIVA
jgi:leucyl-tRNA synthetase